MRQAQAWGRWMWRAGAALPRSNRCIEGLWHVSGSRIGSQRDCKIGQIHIVLVGTQYFRACLSHSQMYRYIFVIGQVEFIGSNMGKHVWDISSMGIYVVPPYHIVSAVEPCWTHCREPVSPFGRTYLNQHQHISGKTKQNTNFKTKWYNQFPKIPRSAHLVCSSLQMLVYHWDALSWRNMRKTFCTT